MGIAAFLSLVNTLFSFPLDKVVFAFVVAWGLYKFGMNKQLFIVFLVVSTFMTQVYIANSFAVPCSPLVFFPIIGILFIHFGIRLFSISALYYSLLIHFAFSLYFLIVGYITRDDLFIHFLYDKGLPFLAAPMGFTSTTQTFGTISLAWLVLFLHRHSQNKIKAIDWVMFGIVFLMIASTFNRMTYVTLLVFLIINNPKIILGIIAALFALGIFFADVIFSVLGASGTVNSRFEHFDHYSSAFETGNFIQKLFGHSHAMILDPRLLNVFDQPIIENGIYAILYSYGLITLIALVAALLIYVSTSKSLSDFKNKLFIAYFILPAQILTNEYFSTSFYFFILCVLITWLDRNKGIPQQPHFDSQKNHLEFHPR